MDFEKLLREARKNELNKKEPVKCLQTKFKPPTKEQHEKDRILSEGVQRFLARKEEEEKRKQVEAERRKQELLALRAKDPKANKRIQTMLKRTKSANKSVMEDAIDINNTADTLAGPSQPDEDDYGFVSESSSQLYNKLIQKMYSVASNDLPKFAPSKKPNTCNLSNTKERVKMALLRQEQEEKLPHKRKRKNKEKKEKEEEEVDLNYSAPEGNFSSFSSDQAKAVQSPMKTEGLLNAKHVSIEGKRALFREKGEKLKAKRLQAPPPVDFHELLKIAEQKQHEPIVFEPKKPQEPEVLMTKKQKIEYEKMQEWKRKRELRLQSLEKGDKYKIQENKKTFPKIQKNAHSNWDEKAQSVTSQIKVIETDSSKVKSQEKNLTLVKRSEKVSKPVQSSQTCVELKMAQENESLDEETSRLIRERNEALRVLKKKEKLIRERDKAVRKLKEKEQLIRERDEAVRKLKLLEESEKVRKSAKITETPLPKQKLKAVVKNSDAVKTCSVKNFASKINLELKNSTLGKNCAKPEMKNLTNGPGFRELPSKDLKPLTKGFAQEDPRNAERGKRFPSADVRRKTLASKRRRIESDEEYDSELDDFIDDDDNEVAPEEVSKVISEIFKYDKNKYSRYHDADDECMESNFAQISKEEFFSTKCGILEDLEDIQREKAKYAKKKKR